MALISSSTGDKPATRYYLTKDYTMRRYYTKLVGANKIYTAESTVWFNIFLLYKVSSA